MKKLDRWMVGSLGRKKNREKGKTGSGSKPRF